MNDQVDLGRMVSIITTSIPWIVNIYVVQLLLMYTFAVLGMYVRCERMVITTPAFVRGSYLLGDERLSLGYIDETTMIVVVLVPDFHSQFLPPASLAALKR